MNENINLVEILKNYPKGTKLYSPLFGIVELQSIDELEAYPIIISFKDDSFCFTKEGKFYNNEHGECLLFPYKNYRDWSNFVIKKPKFDPKTLKPFDKVLVFDNFDKVWTCDLYSYKVNGQECVNPTYSCRCIGDITNKVIPYNEETKHLVGTSNDAPEFYRHWEK